MRKKVNHIYDEYLTIDNLYAMWNIVRITCKNKREIFYFSLNLNTNILNIYNELKNKNYKPDKFRCFMVFVPKARLVMSQSIKDKIINHFITNYYLIPFIDNKLIDSNVATRKNKGSSYSDILLRQYFSKILVNNENREIYCLKIDISKYFYSINHELLINMLRKYIADTDVINLIKIIIAETNKDYVNENILNFNKLYKTDIPYYVDGKGLSIGAMSSQFLAIFYLNNLDHFIKEELKCEFYIRYMDDMLILDTDREKLKRIYNILKTKISDLKINVNRKSNIYKSSIGFNFIGFKYKVVDNKLNVSYNRKTYYRINRRLKHKKKKDYIGYIRSLASYYGYFKRINKKIKEVDFKVKTIDVYNDFKSKNKDNLVIVKEGIFYKTYNEDAIIIWYLFDYVLKDENIVSFGNNSYDKVISKLKKSNINFMFVKDKNIILSYNDRNNTYKSYKNLANIAYDKRIQEEMLMKKLKVLLDKGNYIKDINNYFDRMLKYN